MVNDKKQENESRMTDEISDLEESVNDLELQMVDAKEFSHISREAFEKLQNQISELRELFEQLLVLKTPDEEKRSPPLSEYY